MLDSREKSVPVNSIQFEGSLDVHDIDEYNNIKESVKSLGLFLHPVTLRRLPFDGNGDKYELKSGKKRLRIAKELGHELIPAIILPPTMSDDLVQEVHIHENLRRSNLPWYEVAQLEAELHRLRISQHGQRSDGRPKSGSEAQWSIRDTARELGRAFGTVSESIKLDDAIRNNPQLKKVKDRPTAMKLIREATKRELAIQDQAMPSEFEMNQVFCGDSLDILKMLPDNTFDACITDPPWLEYKDEKLVRDGSTLEVFRELYRVLKPNAFLYAIMSTPDFYEYTPFLRSCGYSVQKWPLIWDKQSNITHGRRPWEYARDFEPILLAAKGSPILTQSTEPSAIFHFPALHPSKLIHPNEKPIELLKKIIVQCSYEGAKIIDPFAGSGVTLQAAKELSREYIGIERDHAFFKQIERRLA